MDLTTLLNAGAKVVGGLVKKSIVWENDLEEKIEFDIFIKQEESAADFEFIFASREEGSAIMARRVARLVRLGNAGEQVIDYETALKFKPSLLLTMCKAINAVQDKVKPPVETGEAQDEKN